MSRNGVSYEERSASEQAGREAEARAPHAHRDKRVDAANEAAARAATERMVAEPERTLNLGDFNVLAPQRRVQSFIAQVEAFHARRPDLAACKDMYARIYGSYYSELSVVERPFVESALESRAQAEYRTACEGGAAGRAGYAHMEQPYSFYRLYHLGVNGHLPIISLL